MLLADAVRRFDDTWASLHQTVEDDVTALAFSLATRILRDTIIERQDAVTCIAEVGLGDGSRGGGRHRANASVRCSGPGGGSGWSCAAIGLRLLRCMSKAIRLSPGEVV